MYSFLVISRQKDKASSYISSFLKEKKIDPIDISVYGFEKAMGIEDVRNLQSKIILRPIKSELKAAVVEAYEGITTEAQNSFLKILEEPSANTLIIVCVSQKELILPTIISRCKIIELNNNNQKLSSDEIAQLLNYSITLSSGSIADKLKLAQDVAKTDETILWLEKMTLFTRQKLIENYNDLKYLDYLKKLQKTYKILKSTNVNQRVALENLFLSF